MKNKNLNFLLKIMLVLSICITMIIPQTIAFAEDNDSSGLILDDCKGHWYFSDYGWKGGIYTLWRFPDQMTVRIGDTIDISSDIYFEDGTRVHCFKGKVTSGDESILTVNGEKSSFNCSEYNLKAINAGSVTLRIVSCDYEGIETGDPHYIDITVIDKSILIPKPASIVPQLDTGIGGMTPRVYCDKIEVGFIPSESRTNTTDCVYELWRSTRKDGGYSKVKTTTLSQVVTESGYGSYFEGGKYLITDTKKVKANTKYYYKIRVRFSYSDLWSDFSEPKAYWTAPKVINNVKYNKSTGRYSWSKAKNVSGYVYWYAEKGNWKFNSSYTDIYQESLYFGTRTTKPYSKRGDAVIDVTPYKKHGDYYYMDSHPITKYKSKLELFEYQGDKV